MINNTTILAELAKGLSSYGTFENLFIDDCVIPAPEAKLLSVKATFTLSVEVDKHITIVSYIALLLGCAQLFCINLKSVSPMCTCCNQLGYSSSLCYFFPTNLDTSVAGLKQSH